jgi:hypothetical protein
MLRSWYWLSFVSNSTVSSGGGKVDILDARSKVYGRVPLSRRQQGRNPSFFWEVLLALVDHYMFFTKSYKCHKSLTEMVIGLINGQPQKKN